MQTAFSLLDSAVAEANANMTDGNRLDPIQVKAIFCIKKTTGNAGGSKKL